MGVILGPFDPDGGGKTFSKTSLTICHWILGTSILEDLPPRKNSFSPCVSNIYGSLLNKFSFNSCCNFVLVIVFDTFSMKRDTCQMFQNVNEDKQNT